MAAACDLCGLPASGPALTRDFDSERRAFCCLGCMNVYTILRESGILADGVNLRDTALFRESLRLGLVSNPSGAVREPIPADAETRESVYHVTRHVVRILRLADRARACRRVRRSVGAEVLFASDLLRVRYCPQYMPPERIAARVAALGYRLSAQRPESEQDHSRAPRPAAAHRSGGLPLDECNGLEPGDLRRLLGGYLQTRPAGSCPLVLMALATPAVFYSAWPILRLAALGARAGRLRMEALVGLGILAAYGYSGYAGFHCREALLLRYRLRHCHAGACWARSSNAAQRSAPPVPSRCSIA